MHAGCQITAHYANYKNQGRDVFEIVAKIYFELYENETITGQNESFDKNTTEK
jgi:hypothetical protein